MNNTPNLFFFSKISALLILYLTSALWHIPSFASSAAQTCFKAKDKPCLEQLQTTPIDDSKDNPDAYDAMYYLGLLYLNEGNSAEAKRQFMMAVAFGKGHHKSKTKLIELHKNNAVQFDAAECMSIESRECLTALANDKNDAAAQFLLGSLIIEDDPQNAAHYLSKAAKQGHKTALCVLAESTQNGRLKTSQNYHDAVEYLERNCLGFSPYKKIDRKHFKKYATQPKHKAYAYSESGSAYSKYGFVSPEAAAKSALISCEQHNKQDDLPCNIINLDGKWVKDYTPSTSPGLLTGIDRLLTNKAKKSFVQQYEKMTSTKVFVQSDIGSWSWKSSSNETLAELTAKVIKKCNSQSGKLSNSFPCRVININGQWQ